MRSAAFRVQGVDRVGFAGAWLETTTTTTYAVTKYYSLAGQRVAMRKGGSVYYIYGDHLGSTSLITDVIGSSVSETRYELYGQVYWQWGATQTDFGFTGQRMDGFGLMDYNARFYDPYLARFISPDTLIPQPGNPLAWDRYAYTFNNPIRYSDPSGHMRIEDNGNDYHYFYPQFDPEVIDHREKWKEQREERTKLPDVGKASTELSNNNYLDRFIGIMKFYKYGSDFSEITNVIDNFGIPAYKKIKGTLPGGPVLEGIIGFSTQLWTDFGNTETPRNTKEIIFRGFIAGVEDGITDGLSSGFGVALGGTAGWACGPAAPVCIGGGYLIGANAVTVLMDRWVWKKVNSHIPIMQ